MSFGLPKKILWNVEGNIWSQKLDYEQVDFKCRPCVGTSHLPISCHKWTFKDAHSKALIKKELKGSIANMLDRNGTTSSCHWEWEVTRSPPDKNIEKVKLNNETNHSQ